MNPNDLLAKGRRALVSASLLLEAGDVEGACNRAYYAMFDAAQAALLHAGAAVQAVRTHQGLISAFGLHLVKTGKFGLDLGKALNQVERIRLLADYTGEAIELELARAAVAQADIFVAAVQRFLDADDRC